LRQGGDSAAVGENEFVAAAFEFGGDAGDSIIGIVGFSRAGVDQNALSEGRPVRAESFFGPSHGNENRNPRVLNRFISGLLPEYAPLGSWPLRWRRR